MKLLSVQLARALWFFDINELNPGGRDIFTHLLPAIIEDYKFKVFPKPGDDLSQGMKLLHGEFVNKDGTVLAVNCTVFNDGITVDTFSSTDDSEEILEEFLTDLPEGFVYSPDMVTRKAYLSQVTVRCSKPLRSLNQKLADFANHISAALGGPVFELSGIEFGPDQTLAIKPASFSFQRKIGEPYTSERYWSQAPVPTKKHLELLLEFEGLLA